MSRVPLAILIGALLMLSASASRTFPALTPGGGGGAGPGYPTTLVAGPPPRSPGDWPMAGRTPERNFESPGRRPPVAWDVEKHVNIKWVQELGSKSYGGPTVADGMVLVGTNNESHRDPKVLADGGVLMAFAEKDGHFLWQRHHAKLAGGRVNDWPGEGLTCTSYTEPGRIWYCGNRCEVMCLDASRGGQVPQLLWHVDMIGELGVFPHNMTHSSPLVYGDLLYVITANGVDDTHRHIPAPDAPSIACFDKNTGKLVWSDNAPGTRILHGQWSSPALAVVNGRALVLAPLGDGWVYAYGAQTGKIVWRFDTNPKDTVYPQTRNELIAMPAIYHDRMYIACGQDPEHGEGLGHLWCVDLNREGDISSEIDDDPKAPKPGPEDQWVAARPPALPRGKPNPNSGVAWQFSLIGGAANDLKNAKTPTSGRMNRTMATCAIDPATGLLFVPDYSGFLHCLDARTGEHYWTDDTESAIWSSSLVCDGKVYQGSEDGFVRIYEAGKQRNKITEHDFASPIYNTVIYANGSLYVMTRDKLYAIAEKK